METAEEFVPQSIKTQGDAADEAIRQRIQPEKGENTASPEETDQTPAADDGLAEPKKKDGTPPEKQTGDGFEAKYKTLKGKYDAEVPRLWSQVNTLTQQNQELTQRIQDMQNAPAAPAETEDEFNPDDFEEYGPDFVRLAETNKRLQQQLDALKGQIGTVATEMTMSQKKNQEAGFYEAMNTLDGWSDQNNDPEFIGWLQNVEPLTGAAYMDILKAAHNASDGNRAAQVFQRFRDETGKSYAQSVSAKQNKIKQPTLAPPRSRSGGAPAGVVGQGRIYTRDEVGQFFNDVAAKRYSEEDAKRIEQDIFKAKHEGRIR